MEGDDIMSIHKLCRLFFWSKKFGSVNFGGSVRSSTSPEGALLKWDARVRVRG